MKKDRDLLFTKEVLKELRISYSTLFRIRKRLGICSKNQSNKLRYSKQEVKLIKNYLKK